MMGTRGIELLRHEDFGLNCLGRDDVGKSGTEQTQRLLLSRRLVGTGVSWVRYELVVSLAILMTLAGAKLVTASGYAHGQSSAPNRLDVTPTVISKVTVSPSFTSTPIEGIAPKHTPPSSRQPALGLTVEPAPETRVPPSSTPVQDAPSSAGAAANVSPPDKLGVENETGRVAGQRIRIPAWLLSVAGGMLVWAAGGIALLSVVTLLFLGTRRRQRVVLSPPQTASIPFLESADGNLYFRLDKLDGGGLVIGRGKRGVDLRIEESSADVDTVSNSHARIYYDATCGYVVIEDLDSTNGIYINGRRAPRKNLLKDGWVIGLGSVTLTYHDGESDTGPLD
jgi:hypothetical protein